MLKIRHFAKPETVSYNVIKAMVLNKITSNNRNKKNILYVSIILIFFSIFLIFQGNYVLVKYHYWIGYIKQKQGNHEKALFEYNKVSKLDPTYPTVYISRGSIYLDLKKYDLAISNYSKAIQLSPNDERAYAYRGRAFYEINKATESIADFNKAIQINPNFGYAYLNRALVKYTTNDDLKVVAKI